MMKNIQYILPKRMIDFSSYIFEKLIINKDIELDYDLEELQNILETVFVYCARYKNYKEGSTFQKDIYLNKIDYNEIIEFIKNHYGREYNQEDIKRNGRVRKIISSNKRVINNWLNRYTTSIKTQNNEYFTISGKELYKKYEDYINKKKNFK